MAISAKDVMLEAIQRDAKACALFTDIHGFSSQVVEAIRSVPRDAFVPESLKSYAWENRPLPIGHGQTISQPFIVALMTALLEPKPMDRVLEVGTGCGYQAAILSLLVQDVYTIEIVEPLAREAAERLKRYSNVHPRVGDGYHGWPEYAPYQGIVVTAGVDVVPPALLEQLASPGRLVIPVSSGRDAMDLLIVEKSETGEISQRPTIPVAFVPFTREEKDADD